MKQANNQQTTPEQPAQNVVNGVDIDVLGGTVGAIQADPGMGACRFRATNNWVDGAQNRRRVTGFYGAHQEIAHKQAFEMLADEPAILAGNDDGANPVEHLLHALASCLTTSMVAHAAVRGIHIEALESELEGDLDLNGFLGLDSEVPKGFTDIRIRFAVKTDADNLEQLKERRLVRGEYIEELQTEIKRVEAEIHLVDWDSNESYERTGLEQGSVSFLDVTKVIQYEWNELQTAYGRWEQLESISKS